MACQGGGLVIISMNIDVSDIIDKYSRAFNTGGMIQSFVDARILEGIAPYVPMDKGNLHQSAIDSTEIGSGMIVWSAPYAKYVWDGKSKSGKDLNFQRDKHPLAGKMWAERYKSDHLEELRYMVIKKVNTI